MRAWVAAIGVVLLLGCHRFGSRHEDARRSLRTLYDQTRSRVGLGNACPTPEKLFRAGEVQKEELRDPWGQPYRIECKPTIRVFSAGPDGRWKTGDDLAEPREML